MKISLILFSAFWVCACAGMKVIDPNAPKTEGMMQVDYSDGSLKLVATHTCTMVAANGQRVYGSGKSEDEAQKETISKCQSQSVVSFCNISKISCKKN